MFCKRCGTNLPDDALFCENCGNPVRTVGQIPTAPVEPVVPVVEERPAVNMPYQPSAPVWQEPAPVKPKRSSAKWLIPVVIAAVAIVVAAAVAVILLLSGGGGNSDSFYQEMNFNNVAYFAYDSNRLYFVAEYDDDAEDTSLYSTDHNGINKKLISDNANIIRIRVVDGKIYYQESGDQYSIGVMDTDGSNDRIIVTTENIMDKYAVSGDKLYYLTDNQLYVCDLSGGESELLVENVSTFVLGSKALYYAQEDVISSFDLNSRSSQQLSKAEGASDLALNGNILYFSCDSGLCTVDVKGDGSVTRLIRDTELDSYVVYGDHIYYCHEFTTDEIAEIAEYLADDSSEVLTYKLLFIGAGQLYRANLDGSDAQKVENTDDSIIFALYTFPKGMYYKMTAFSDNINAVEFE